MNKKASIYFVITAIIIIVAGFIDRYVNKDNGNFVLNVYDTYYVAARFHIAQFIFIIYAFLGAGYWVFNKLRLGLNKQLTAVHTFASIAGVVLYWMVFLYSLFRKETPYGLMSISNADFLELWVIRIVVIVTLVQPLYLINFVIGIIKRNKI